MRRELNPFSNVAPGKTGSLVETGLDGYTLAYVQFVLGGGLTKDKINRVELTIGGRNIIDHATGTDLENICHYVTNQSSPATDLWLLLSNPNAPDYHGKHFSGADLSVIKDPSNGNAAAVAFQIDLDATAPAGSTFQAIAHLEPAKRETGFDPRDWKQVKAYARSQFTPGGALAKSNLDVALLSHARAAILREYWTHTGHLKSLIVKKDNIILLDDVAQAQSDSSNLVLGRHPTIANLFVFDATAENNPERMLPTTRDVKLGGNGVQLASFQHQATTDAADTLTVLVETVVDHDNI